MIEAAYRYRATLIRAIDGDTYVMDVDLGFFVHNHVTVRLRGIDTPELATPEGPAARAFAVAALMQPSVVVETYKDRMTFARWVADVYCQGESLADLLRKAGHEAKVTT